MADIDRVSKKDRLAGLSTDQRTRVQQRLIARAAAKLRAAAAEAEPAVRRAAESNASVEPGEPIAIVGMSCRFAGAPDLQAYWRMIRDGVEGAAEIPEDRWPIDEYYDPAGGPGKMATRRLAFLDQIDQFEPGFFNITPREAARMDPQQRLLLEVAWETCENAGWPADRLAGSSTGVYVGVGGTDYMKAPIHSPNYFELIDAHVGTGNALSIASNRVSFALDLRGPSMSVDTACSSGSLAIHLAAESLRRGDSDAALAGGVNAIITPEVTIAFSNAQMLSPEGRCRSYDAGASGYVRGEGCAFVLLKRLKDAQRDGDDVLAVLAGTAANQDGRTPGISAPSVVQQQDCLLSALADAGLKPADVDYIEGHGTGTPLGDPVELQALAHVFRRESDTDPPLWLTSVKANIGHTETVSGVAGLIKAVLLMQNETVPPQLHFEQLNPHAQIDRSRVTPVTEAQPWPSRLAEGGRPRVAGVSSFGFGGTNTHLVVTEPPSKRPPEQSTPPKQLVKLAAKTPDRLRQQAEQLAAWLRSDAGRDAELADVACTMNTGRADFGHRVALLVENRQELLARLDEVAAGDAAEEGLPTRSLPRTAWLFTGQGAQRWGMGRELYDAEPNFRDVFDRCSAVLEEAASVSLIDVLHGGDESLVNETRYTQPALFAIECGLAALWRSWGVEPDVLVGHSIGEYAAAVTAGVLKLEDGARLVTERARLMHSAPGEGGMAVVFADEATVAPVLAGREARLAIAAVNGPQSTVLSGDVVELEAALADLTEQEIASKRLTVSHAFHSPLMDPVLDEFERFAGQFEHHRPRVSIASNVTGQLIGGDSAPDDWPRYWRDHLRGAVRFAEGVSVAADLGATHWIEIGPAPILAGMAARCDAPFKETPRWIASLRPDSEEWATLFGALASHWSGGGAVDWRALHRDRPGRRLPLPNYPMHRERFWYEDLQPRGATVARAAANASPVLGGRVPVAGEGVLFEAPLDERTPAWLVDHQVRGTIVAPAAMFVEQALAAAAELAESDGAPLRVDGVVIRQALAPPEGERLRLQTLVERPAMGRRRVTIHSAPADQTDAAWVEHVEATLVDSAAGGLECPSRDGFDARVVEQQTRDRFYRTIAERGLEYGQAFRVLDDVRRTPYDATADLVPSRAVAADLERYRLHPAIGDALLQSIAAVAPREPDGSASPHTYLPVRIESVRVQRPINPGEPLTAYTVRTSPTPESDESSPETIEADAWLLDATGAVVAALCGVQVQRMASASDAEQESTPGDWLYELRWRSVDLCTGAESPAEVDWPAGPTLLLADDAPFAEAIAESIESRGGSCLVATPGKAFSMRIEEKGSTARTRFTYDPSDATHDERLVEMLAANPSGKPAAVVHAHHGEDWEQTAAALRLTQALARRSVAPERGVWFVTHNAQAVGVVGEAPASPAQAARVGFGRVAAMEQPERGVRLLDLDRFDATSASLLVDEIAAAAGEGQIAHRDGERYVARLAHAESLADAVASDAGGAAPPDAPSWRLGLRRAGSFDGLAYEPFDPVEPGPGQVQMKVHATGLNFSDVLKALGLYPGMKESDTPLGIESSGVITAVGEGVEHLRVGDEAIGVLPYAFASHATTAAYAVVPKPAGLSHEEGATLPIVFLTAHHALVNLARLEAGERVLIHAAAGGVGLAALQIAQAAGAEVFATAGSDKKRDRLRSLGVKHVMDSRSLDFVDQVREATGGEGVDVVLNSLPGEAIDASLGLLRAYGRFCEIGKIDIYQDRKIGLLPFQDNLSYFAIDLDRLLRERPQQVTRLYAEVMQRFTEGVYKPLPYTRFATAEVADAFRYMSQRKNLGKVVVSMRPEASDQEDGDSRPVIAGAGYLVTGGLGALGRRVAEWLAANGAGGVALVSRREPDEEAKAFLDSLGVPAVGLSGDAADRESLAAALDELPKDFPPIAGVIHAAGVLDDGLIGDLDAGRLDRVLRPKALGAWNLHELTQQPGSPLADVRQFVLFSSVAAALGSPGQTNYAAANASLDALANHRHTLGLSATSLGWGPWAADASADGGAGMAAGETADAVRGKGMDLLPPSEALDLMGRLMVSDASAVAVFDARWDALSRLLSGRATSTLEDLLVDADQKASGRGDSALRQRLLTAEPDERRDELIAMVRGELARVTSVTPEEIDTAAPLATIGIDSLMALELKNNLESKLAITLPMGKLLAGPSVASLAEAAADELVGAADEAPVEPWRPLVTLQEGEPGKPALFLMPVLGGDVGAYRELADAAPEGLPVKAVRSRGLDTDDPPHDRMDELASDYAAAIRAAQPEGPYHLAGWSTGGVTALAVAQRLEAEGAEVGRVALLDTPPPSVYEGVDTKDHAVFLHGVAHFIARFSGLEDLELSHEHLAGLPEARRLAAVRDSLVRSGLAAGAVDDAYVERLVAVGEALVVATQGYTAGDLAAPVTFFSPQTAGGLDGVTVLPDHNVAHWRERYGDLLTEHAIPGDHFTMMRGEGAAAMAEWLG
ncbi:Phthiocerol synthesis polyketide synthase type I PpsC [Planctomycetes bacterium MalM25]|nr:Phthiocerol synthesis polyketide synthase type I PpsC [Planctomycetes bacterium MalM25]